MGIDNDEQLDGMCEKCKTEATAKNKCNRCGKTLTHAESGINKNFDPARFDRLSSEDSGSNPNFDHGRFDKLDK